MPSNHLILSSPSPAFNLSHHQGLFPWISSLHQVAKKLEFQLQHVLCSRFSLVICFIHAATAKSLQSCPTLCDPIDGSPPGSPVPGILQARTLEWVAISFSSAWKWKVKVKSLSHVQLSDLMDRSLPDSPPSMGFSRQEYRSGVPLPSVYICQLQSPSSSHLLFPHVVPILLFSMSVSLLFCR